MLGYGSMDRRFFHRLGASQLDRTICATAGGDGLPHTSTAASSAPIPSTSARALIIAWGANIHGTNVHLWPLIEEARPQRRPSRSSSIPTAPAPPSWPTGTSPIHPGTDAALALGMMHVIFAEGLEDRAYIDQHTVGCEGAGGTRARNITPERVADWTGMTADEIRALAREYATTQPAAIRLNYGIQRMRERRHRRARRLPCCRCSPARGSISAAACSFPPAAPSASTRKRLERPDLMYASPLGRAARVVNMSRLGHALTELSDPPGQGALRLQLQPRRHRAQPERVLRGMARPTSSPSCMSSS